MSNEDLSLLRDWRQGDLAMIPVETAVLSQDEDGHFLGSTISEHGVAIVSQSCDVVRSHEKRPFVQVAALISASEEEVSKAVQGMTPSRISLPALADRSLVIDLDVCMTVKKEVVATWPRVPGCYTDDERRRFSQALSRHRQRFAFPDEFNDLIKPLKRWFESKSKSNSSNGRLVRNVREVRVWADSWTIPQKINFYFLLSAPVPKIEIKDWDEARRGLEEKLSKKSDELSLPHPDVVMLEYSNMSALQYVGSDKLEWDGLSDSE